jgi:hypothetical protein
LRKKRKKKQKSDEKFKKIAFTLSCENGAITPNIVTPISLRNKREKEKKEKKKNLQLKNQPSKQRDHVSTQYHQQKLTDRTCLHALKQQTVNKKKKTKKKKKKRRKHKEPCTTTKTNNNTYSFQRRWKN